VTDGPANDLRTRVFSYNTSGLLSQTADPLGRTVHLAYDAANRPQSLTLFDGGVVGFECDAENHLTAVTPPDDRSTSSATTPLAR
jgi:YD repeat-containing protein